MEEKIRFEEERIKREFFWETREGRRPITGLGSEEEGVEASVGLGW